MNAIARFFSFGMQDADRRIAAVLAPPPLASADRYLNTSGIVMTIDRATRRLQAWWRASETGRAAASIAARVGREPRPERYQAIGLILLTAVAVNVAFTLVQGPRPGWFWMFIPAMAATIAALMLAGSRR